MGDFDDDLYFDDLGLMDELMVDKSAQRDELAQLFDEFLARGGKVQQVDPSATGIADGMPQKRYSGMEISRDKQNANIRKQAQARKMQLIRAIRSALALPDSIRPSLDAICTMTKASRPSIRALLHHEFKGDPRAVAMLDESDRRRVKQ